jgi:hypothetical protein
MPLELEATITSSEGPQTYALDRTAIGNGYACYAVCHNVKKRPKHSVEILFPQQVPTW